MDKLLGVAVPSRLGIVVLLNRLIGGLKEADVQLVPNLPVLELGHFLAHHADLRAGFIFLLGDEPPFNERCAADMVGGDGGDVVGEVHLIDVVLDADFLPGLVVIGLKLRVALDILPALEREGGAHLIAFIIGEPFLVLVIQHLEIPKVCPRIAEIKFHHTVCLHRANLQHPFLLLAPCPVGAGPDGGDILHPRIEGQRCCLVAAVDPLDLLGVTRKLCWI